MTQLQLANVSTHVRPVGLASDRVAEWSQALHEADFAESAAEAEAWLRCPHHEHIAAGLLSRLIPWMEAGVAPSQAAQWCIANIAADRGLVALRHGWTAWEFRKLVICMTSDSPARAASDRAIQAALEDWSASEIPPRRALRYCELGLTTAAARDLEQRRAAGEQVDAAIDTLLALRRGPHGRPKDGRDL